jgi:ABC-type polar amino acid transport system ATPase subunit
MAERSASALTGSRRRISAGFARRAADRVLVLADGKIVEEGPPERVLDKPQTERTQQFLRRVLV